ncbi:FadR/GntR family transcriptional regulator [Caulobacter sp. LARHSG274]
MAVSSPRKPAKRRVSTKSASPDQPLRLYKKVVRQLVADLRSGKYAVGDRLPGERELAIAHGVSRPAVREAVLALEVRGLVEVRIGSGTYVVRLSESDEPDFTISAFEAMEARLLIEGEAAALACLQITESEIAELDGLVARIAVGNRNGTSTEEAEAMFSQVLARATRNGAIEKLHGQLWQLRFTSPECALLLEKARAANVRPVVDEYTAIVEAMRRRDPAAARTAMRAHLNAVIDHLLFAIEEEAVAAARQSVLSTRKRHARVANL